MAHRRPLSLTTMLGLLLLFSSTASAAYAVLGIDLGTNFIKAAIVKPGTPLDIVLTKDSKRKEAAVVGFKPTPKGPVELGSFPERLYGGDALALAGRFPGEVYTHLKPLLGIDPSTAPVVDEFKARYPAIKVQTSKSSVAVSSGAFNEQEEAWTVEELLAMELKDIRVNAETMAGEGSKVTEAVITIPAFYTADERRAVERAADMAGLNIMALIPDGLAVGIDYAVKREFPNVSKGGKPETHLVFDMGASSTTATILRFQSRDVKDVGKYNKTIYEVTTLGTGWDRTLGGNALNEIVLDHIVSEFVKKPDASSAGITAKDVTSHGRTASKLWREAERARQVLSANSDVRSSFEGLFNDIDFATKLSRAEFEDLASTFADRVEAPINQALQAAKISIADLDSIILHGGAIRTPFVQKKLESIAGKAVEVRSNVNSDESAAFGAAFKAARLSPSFRVKEIRDSESASYPAGITQNQAGKDRQQQIFIPTSLSGTSKDVQLKDKSDFEFSVYQKVDGKEHVVQTIQTKNLTAGVKALNDKFGCAADEVSTQFTLRLSPVNGIPEVVGGTVSCKVEGTGAKGGIVDSVKGFFGGKKNGQEPLKAEDDDAELMGDSSTTTSPAASEPSKSGKEAESAKKDAAPVVRTETIPISLTTVNAGLPVPDKVEANRMIGRLAAFDRSDKARVDREEALNTLEAFTYRARDLITNAGFEEASTQAVRDQISSLLSSTSEWLYGEGSTATSEVLKAKLKDLKSLIEPVQKRQQDTLARPEAIKLLQQALNSTKSFMDSVTDQIAKAAAEASSAAAAAATDAASSVSSAVTPSSSDDLDDLEEADETSTSTPSAAAPTKTSLLPTYTEEDLAGLSASYDSIVEWLKEKTALQDTQKPYEDAALSIKLLEEKTKSLQSAMMSLVQKKIKPPPRKSSAKSKIKSKTKSAKSAAKSAASDASSVVSSGSSAASEAASSVAGEATSSASVVSESISSAVSGAASSISSGVSVASGSASSAVSQVAESIGSVTEEVKSAASEGAEKVASLKDEL